MVEERVTEVEGPDGRPQTRTHTVVVDSDRRGSGATWVIVLLVLVAIVVAIWAFSTYGGAEVAKDNAIADAASEVGDAANQVGDAAQDAANSVR